MLGSRTSSSLARTSRTARGQRRRPARHGTRPGRARLLHPRQPKRHPGAHRSSTAARSPSSTASFAQRAWAMRATAGDCTHNIYMGKNSTLRYDQTIFQFNWTHDLASDTPDKGHLFKCRSRESDVLYNRITGETGHDSYEVDIPNGGLGIVVGNVIEKGADRRQLDLLTWRGEASTPAKRRPLRRQQHVRERLHQGTFITSRTAGCSSPTTTSSRAGHALEHRHALGRQPERRDPLFVDQATTTITSGGLARHRQGRDPGRPPTLRSRPRSNTCSRSERGRLTQHDLGAFEYGTVITHRARVTMRAAPATMQAPAPATTAEGERPPTRAARSVHRAARPKGARRRTRGPTAASWGAIAAATPPGDRGTGRRAWPGSPLRCWSRCARGRRAPTQ